MPSDSLGRITVPDVVASGTFPAIIDWGHSFTYEIPVAVHPIENRTANKQIEQRFKLGPGTRRFSLHSTLNQARRAALIAFLDAREGPYQPFTLNWPNEAGTGTTTYIACFTDAFTLDRVTDALTTTGLELVEVKTASFPTYTVASTQTRFPSAGLPAALLAQEQELIPLIHLKVKEAAVTDNIFLSDRRCTVGGQLYQARLIDWDGITQELGGSADAATFRFGNADRVMTLLANDTLLDHAVLTFSVFHVGTGIKLDLWAGEIVTWQGEAAPVFSIQCGDPARELNQSYPLRRPSRLCDKPYGNSAAGCPALLGNPAGLDTTNFPTADEDTCDHTYDGDNGCMAHSGGAAPNTLRSFHGIFAKSQKALVKFTGPSKGVRLTSCSQLDETIWSQEIVMPEIHTDISMPVKCLLVSGRDENDYYSGLGIVGEGPLQLSTAYKDHTLDGSPGHDPNHWPWWGLRTIPGTDPAGAADYFSIGQKDDHTAGDFRKAFDGTNTWDKIYLAGTAFIDIRRKDAKGLQLTPITEHQMLTRVWYGLGGWAWSAPSTRTWQSFQTNPVWIAVNKYLRARGVYFASAAIQETYFDCVAEIAAAAICNLSVPKLVGTGNETQFKFLGQLRDQKPLRDWLQEILNNCLGWFCFSNGKLKIGIRENSSAVEAYTAGNIIADSLVLTPLQPAFNRLIGQFANAEILDDAGVPQWSEDNIPVQDIAHAAFIAGASGVPQYLSSTMTLAGCATRSQTARVISTRLREELGGVSQAEWTAARNIVFKTTILGLHSEVGQVDSLTHPDMPGGAGEFRVTAWRLNPDWSVEIAGRSTTDSMYDLTYGPKPADVVPSAVPPESDYNRLPWPWHAGYTGPTFLYSDERFGVQQEYGAAADGAAIAQIPCFGNVPINSFSSMRRPAITLVDITPTGGTIPGGSTVYVGVAALDALGTVTTPLSVLYRVDVPVGTNTNLLTLHVTWPDGAAWCQTFAGVKFGELYYQQASAPAATLDLSSVTLLWGGPPDPLSSCFVIRAKREPYPGIWTAPVALVSSFALKIAGAAFTVNQFAGHHISLVANASMAGPFGVWVEDFLVISNTADTLTLSTDPTLILAGDMITCRGLPDTFTATTIGTANFVNCFLAAGLPVSGLKGKILRVISGLAKGDVRAIIDNTATVITVNPAFSVTPDATTRFIIEDPDWFPEAVTQAYKIESYAGASPRIGAVGVPNEAGSFFVQVQVQSEFGERSDELLSPFREIYLFGNTGTSDISVSHGGVPVTY